MLPYFPFTDQPFKMTLGVRPLEDGRLIEIDPLAYQAEITLKQELLRTNHSDYFQSLPATEDLQWEAVETLLPNLALHYPQHFQLTVEGDRWTWHNRLQATTTDFRLGLLESLPLAPLDWLGRQVQEDLLLLKGTPADGMPLVAGQLCFPNAWCLEDKLGRSFLEIHDEVALFREQIGRSSNLLLERLKVGRPAWRINWAFKSISRLNLTPRFLPEARKASLAITPENAGERCFMRLERQTLARLPKTQALLFTIHTYQETVTKATENINHARRINHILQTTPKEVLIYKGIEPFIQPLLAYLAARIEG